MEQPSLFPLDEYTQTIDLEPIEDTLVCYLGRENAAQVVAALGGLSIRVPRQNNSSQYSRLEEALGADLAQLMVDKFGGEELYINKGQAEAVLHRHKEVLDTYRKQRSHGNSKSQSIQQTALKMELTARHVRRILSQHLL